MNSSGELKVKARTSAEAAAISRQDQAVVFAAESGVMHALVDCACGAVIYREVSAARLPAEVLLSYVLVYSTLAFGLQWTTGGASVSSNQYHRVAISDHRLVSFDGERVTFRWKDYAHGSKIRPMTLTATEFLRRFFLHVLPKGFVRIRHFGFLGNRFRAARVQLCRQLLANAPVPSAAAQVPHTDAAIWHCPRCGTVMIIIQRFASSESLSRCTYFDSS